MLVVTEKCAQVEVVSNARKGNCELGQIGIPPSRSQAGRVRIFRWKTLGIEPCSASGVSGQVGAGTDCSYQQEEKAWQSAGCLFWFLSRRCEKLLMADEQVKGRLRQSFTRISSLTTF